MPGSDWVILPEPLGGHVEAINLALYDRVRYGRRDGKRVVIVTGSEERAIFLTTPKNISTVLLAIEKRAGHGFPQLPALQLAEAGADAQPESEG